VHFSAQQQLGNVTLADCRAVGRLLVTDGQNLQVLVQILTLGSEEGRQAVLVRLWPYRYTGNTL